MAKYSMIEDLAGQRLVIGLGIEGTLIINYTDC